MSVWMRHEYWPSNGWSDKRQTPLLLDLLDIEKPAEKQVFLSLLV
ncbi:Uncharacterised protein [Serratia proteamaculans]|nr:Uncharacterised protein [Serratia proteamaculans]CAI2484215.1 Uncharacterised protein [Serratia proteamaculans]